MLVSLIVSTARDCGSRLVCGTMGHDFQGEALKEDLSNYKDWSIEMRSYLMSKGLWSVVQDKAPADPKENMKVVGIIGLSLGVALRRNYCDDEKKVIAPADIKLCLKFVVTLAIAIVKSS